MKKLLCAFVAAFLLSPLLNSTELLPAFDYTRHVSSISYEEFHGNITVLITLDDFTVWPYEAGIATPEDIRLIEEDFAPGTEVAFKYNPFRPEVILMPTFLTERTPHFLYNTAPSHETKKLLPCITSIKDTGIIFFHVEVTLSDGSRWESKGFPYEGDVHLYWKKRDKVIVNSVKTNSGEVELIDVDAPYRVTPRYVPYHDLRPDFDSRFVLGTIISPEKP